MSYKKKSHNERYEEELAKAHERLYPRKKRLAHNNGPGSYSDGSLQGVNIFDQQNLVQDFGELLGVQNLDFDKPLSKSRSDLKAKQTRNFPLLQKSQKHLKYIRHNVCSASKQRAHVSTSIPEKSKTRSRKESKPDSESQYDCQEDESYDGFYRHGIAENVKNRGRMCKPATDCIRPKDCDFGEQLCIHEEKNNFKLKEIIDETDCKEQRNKLKKFHNKSKEDRKHKHRRKLESYEEIKKVNHNDREHKKSSKIKKKRKTRTCSIVIHACREISCMLEYNSKVKGKLTDLTINLASLSVRSIHSNENSPVSNSLNSEPVNDDLEMDHLAQNCEIPVLNENALLVSTKPDGQLEKCDSSPLEINEIEDMSDDDIIVLEESSKFNVQISQICSTPNWEIKKEIPDDNSSCDINTGKSSVIEKDEVIELSDDEIEILEVKASETKSLLNNEKVESSNTSVSISAQSTLQQGIDNVKISNDSMPTIEGVDKSISKLLNNLSENKVPSLSELCPVTVQSLPCNKKPDKNNSTLSLNQFTIPECKVKYDEIEDELDSNAIANILSLNPDKESTISPLIELFERESKDLQTIQYAVRNYSNVAAGLKMLEKEKLKRLQSMTYALKKLEGSKTLNQMSNPIIQHSSTFQNTMPVQQCINNILSENVNEQFIKQAPATEQCPIPKFENCVSQNLVTTGSRSLGSTNYSPTHNLCKDSDISISKPNTIITRTESSSEDVEIVQFLKPPPPYHLSHTMPSSHSKQVFSSARHESPNSKCFESPTISHKKRSGSSQDFNKVSSVQGRFCQVCRKKAVFACQGCEKVFFCSNACGVSFWNDGHSAVC